MEANDMRKIKIMDTTLSAGEQSLGCSMNIYEKVSVARQLEKLGVDIIEVGFAARSEIDYQTIQAICKIINETTVCSLARLNKNDIDVAYEALKDAKNKRVNIIVATSDIYCHKYKITKDTMIKDIKEIITYAKQKFQDIEISLEDAVRTDLAFICNIIESAIKSGATTINICDTFGFFLPEEIAEYINNIKSNVKNIHNVNISVHCHNDLGNAVSNSLTAIKIGTNQVECTINGIGKRAGSASLEEIIVALDVRKDYFKCCTNINLNEIYPSCQLISQITEMPIPHNKPIVGLNTFKTATFLQENMFEDKIIYNIIDSQKYGFYASNFIFGRQPSHHEIIQFINSIGIDINDVDFNLIIEKLNQLGEKNITIDKLRKIIDESKLVNKKM